MIRLHPAVRKNHVRIDAFETNDTEPVAIFAACGVADDQRHRLDHLACEITAVVEYGPSWMDHTLKRLRKS